MGHPHAELVRRGYEAFAAGDLTAYDALLDEAVVFHVMGQHPFAGDHVGKDAIYAYLAAIVSGSPGTLRITVDGVLAGDDGAVVLATTTRQVGSEHLRREGLHRWRIVDGVAVEMWDVPYDVAADTAFWTATD